jgi:hypothetical protein
MTGGSPMDARAQPHDTPRWPVAPTPPPRDGWADALDEARELEGASFEERYALLRGACELVFEILSGHPRREQILAYQEPLPPESLALIERAKGG